MEKLAVEVDEKLVESLNEELHEKLEAYGIDEATVLDEARQNLMLWDGFFNENIVRGKDDLNFVIKDQWSAVERSEFSRTFKPAMTFNKVYDPLKKIAGEQRKNKPDLLVRSLTGKADQAQIDLRADLVRTISYQSQNDLVYQTAFMSALMMGFGAFEVSLDYEGPRSFNKTAKYGLIEDASKTSFDPTAKKPHKGDGNFCSRQYLYTKEEFYATFPNIENPVSYSDSRSLLDLQWQTRDSIVVCKYTQKEWYPVHIYKLSNGMVVTEDEWEDMQKQMEMVKNMTKESLVVKDIVLKDFPTIKADRKSQDYIIHQYLLTQNRIIDCMRWPSKQLPIIFVDGDSHFIDGQQYTKSFVRDARDAQRFVNYVGSEIAAEIKNRRREQWIGTPDNIQGYEQMWRQPELQMGILLAKPDPKTGQMPTKMVQWELPQSLLAQFQRGSQDIREIMGFSETEELQGRDMSGKARRERKIEGAMSAYVQFDNLNQAIEQSGRVVLDLLPHIVGDDERHMILSKPDGRTESVIFNQNVDGEVKNRLLAGEYDIEIDTGASFAVQKDIALEFFQQTIQANPQTFPLIADLWAKNLDVQFMPQIAERFKTLVPPQIIAQEEGKKLPPQSPSPQEQMMNAEMQAKQSDIAIKQQKMQLDMQKLELEKQKLMLEAQKMKFDAQLDVYNHNADLKQAEIDHRFEREKMDKSHLENMSSILADLHKHHTSNP